VTPQHSELDNTGPRPFSRIARQLPVSRVFLFVTLLVSAVLAERGSFAETGFDGLDPTFGVGGLVTSTGFSTQLTGSLLYVLGVSPRAALAVQSDSKIVAAAELDGGGFGVVRYLPDGSPDSTFGVSGRVNTFVGSQAAATAVIVQPDGKVVAGGFIVGAQDFSIALARYQPNGSLDPTFNGSGTVLREGAMINAIAPQPDGKLVWAGASFYGIEPSIGRYLSTGAPDPSFGVGCALVLPGFAFTSIVLQPDGKLLVSGVNDVFLPSVRIRWRVVARISPEGCLDPTFGVSGQVLRRDGCTPVYEDYCTWESIGLQGDGKIVVAGSDGSDFVVARYLADGTPDPSFGATGQVATDFSGGLDRAFALAVRTDGRITVAGSASPTIGSTYPFGLARYNADGTLDDSFGSFGKLTTDFGDGSVATSMAPLPDGKFVVAGLTGNYLGGTVLISIARYLADSTACPVNTLAALPQSQSFASTGAGTNNALNPSTFRKLRDQKLATTPQGRRLIALYNEHGAEVTSLLLKDAALRASLLKGLLIWQPHATALAEGNNRKSSALVVTAEQALVVDEVVERLTLLGSGELVRSIARERKMIPPGLSTAEGLLRAIEQ
jgi:uncharacterized delta-60 repeat protein